MPTIKEVAMRARVSVGTVSNVLGGRVVVSERLRTRVLEVIERLDYHPNFIARSLKIRHTQMIGIVVSDITNPFSTQMVRGAEDAAWQKNYTLIILNSDGQLERERQVIAALRTRQVDGILLVAATGGEHRHIDAVTDAGIPVVCVDHELSGPELDCVVVDHFSGARDCVAHLIAMGHRRIGMLNGDTGLPVAEQRFSGYRQALADANLPYDETIVANFGFRVEDGYRAAQRVLACEPRPSAIFTGNAMIAMGLLRALREAGLGCPEDVAIATFDDPIFLEALRPTVTAVAQPAYELGRRSVDLLLERIGEPERKRTRVVLETHLIVRESSGKIAKATF
jgi:LacI family transcriptional regulator